MTVGGLSLGSLESSVGGEEVEEEDEVAEREHDPRDDINGLGYSDGVTRHLLAGLA